MSKIIMICAAPGAGKSTLTKTFTDNGFLSLNRDSEGGKIVDLLPKMEALILDKKDIVLDNVFPTIEVRKPFLELAKRHGLDISCKWLTTSIEEAAINVVQRAIGLTGKFPTHEVIKQSKHTNIFPPVVLFRYKKEFQKPTLAEGFSNVEEIKFIRKDDISFKNKALIVDYDSTIRECVNGNGKYPLNKDQIRILPNRKEVLQSYKDKGYLLLGISNQSGVAKGELTNDNSIELFEHTNKLLGLDIDYKFCPHQSAPISCYCRKPGTGLFVDFMVKYKLDRKQCKFVGDMTSDSTMAKRAGISYMDQLEFFKG